jgi:hypothetical protein
MAKATQRQQRRQSATRQYGGRVLVFRGAPLQRGHGLGGLFKTLLRVAVPVLRRAAPIVKRTAVRVGKAASKRAVKAGAKALEDVATNKSTLKEALKQRVQEAAFNAAAEVINKGVVSQSVNTSRRKSKSQQVKRKRKTNAPRL